MGASLVERILARLESAERHEVYPHLQDDYRIAWITVLNAARGDCLYCTPHVAATYAVLGLHPDKVWPAIVAYRKALLGSYWNADDARWAGEEFGAPPKKPVESVRLPARKAFAQGA